MDEPPVLACLFPKESPLRKRLTELPPPIRVETRARGGVDVISCRYKGVAYCDETRAKPILTKGD